MQPNRILKWVGAALLVIVLAGLVLRKDPALEVAKAKLQDAQAVAAAARSDAARALAREAQTDGVVVALRQAERLARSRADSLERQRATQAVAFNAAASAAPDTCHDVIEKARIALTTADSAVAAEQKVAVASTSRADSLQVLVDSSTSALRGLLKADVAVGRAATAVVHAASPSLFSKLKPRLGVGLAAGVDAEYKLRVVLGFTLGWVF